MRPFAGLAWSNGYLFLIAVKVAQTAAGGLRWSVWGVLARSCEHQATERGETLRITHLDSDAADLGCVGKMNDPANNDDHKICFCCLVIAHVLPSRIRQRWGCAGQNLDGVISSIEHETIEH